MYTKQTSYFKLLCRISVISISFSLMISACNQLTRYDMDSRTNEQDSYLYTDQPKADILPIIYSLRNNPLHIATQCGDLDTVKKLCSDPNIDVNTKDYLGQTPLHLAAYYGHLSIVMDLFSRPYLDVNQKDMYRRTPLHLAALMGHVQIVEVLLEAKGIQVNEKTDSGETALDIALQKNNQEVVELLRKIVTISGQ